MSKRAAIYARVSTDMQRDNFSIPSQVGECERYAIQHEYTIVGDQYVDRRTGYTTGIGNGAIPAFVDDLSSREVNRPGLNAAQDYLDTFGYDILIVHALDRLARDPYIRQTLEREINQRGAKVEYVLGNYEDSPEGDVRKDLDATFAKWENQKRTERFCRGKRKKAENGKFVHGRPPYGYVLDKDVPGGLRIVPDQAEVVEQVFELFVVKRLSIYQIIDELYRMGVLTQRGAKKWGKTSVRRFLSCTAYIGYVYYNKYIMRGGRLVYKDRGEWIKIPVQPLISKELYDAAQTRLQENREMLRRHPKRSYLLTGMILCEHCKRPYQGQTKPAGLDGIKQDYSYYAHRLNSGHCMNHQISTKKVDPVVWEAITDLLLDPEQLKEGYRASLEQQRISRKRHEEHLCELRITFDKLKQRKQNLARAYTDPDIQMPKSEYLALRDDLEGELSSVTSSINEIENQLSTITVPEDFETLERFAKEVRERINNPSWQPTLECKKEILSLLHVKVWIDKEGAGKITGWFSGEVGFSSTTCEY